MFVPNNRIKSMASFVINFRTARLLFIGKYLLFSRVIAPESTIIVNISTPFSLLPPIGIEALVIRVPFPFHIRFIYLNIANSPS